MGKTGGNAVTLARQAGSDALDLVREVGASVLAYELYPLGLAVPSTPFVPPFWRTKSKRPPVLFVHGLLHNTAAFTWIKQRMAIEGWSQFGAASLRTTRRTIAEMAEELAETIAQLKHKYSAPEVDIVAHSMGGIVARYALQVLGEEKHVRKLVTLGSPHQGTWLSKYGFLRSLKDLQKHSEVMRVLKEQPVPSRTQVISIHGSLDIVVWPQNAHWEGVRNVPLRGVGHAGLLFSNRVLQILVANLLEPERETFEAPGKPSPGP
jgi:triacylglycerol lipase